ncbi:hypothetical protein HPB48_026236 [Haemaphysalis longicornis]|uniref:Uncharacterized protein n=1 Tax=Haemaphysalis longicornis TaxID=44386 RepID=A0A9J6H0M8_HAELO|nr:hypothetical protein HPB48_026236 [Haemaphysalis longicornis]
MNKILRSWWRDSGTRLLAARADVMETHRRTSSGCVARNGRRHTGRRRAEKKKGWQGKAAVINGARAGVAGRRGGPGAWSSLSQHRTIQPAHTRRDQVARRAECARLLQFVLAVLPAWTASPGPEPERFGGCAGSD